MKMALFAGLILIAPLARAGLEEYPDLVKADAVRSTGSIRVTYLGVNGYLLQSQGHALFIDPYVTRLSLGAVLSDKPVQSDPAQVAAALKKIRPPVPRADAVLVTHAHFDHLFDVAPIMTQTGARIYAGPTAIQQMRALKLPERQFRPITCGEVYRIGPWTIRAMKAAHDRLFMAVPMKGDRKKGDPAPQKPSDWVLGEPLAFIVEAAGKRIYIDSGGSPELLPPQTKVNLAILGVALPDARRHFAPAVRQLNPDYILPSHQDDFFQPLASGFAFGKLTDFPAVRRIAEREKLSGELILLDYFRPWTLP